MMSDLYKFEGQEMIVNTALVLTFEVGTIFEGL